MVEFHESWYENLFENSNEKSLLAQKIADLRKGQNNESFLEIGMGTSPFFAKNLSELFKEYWIVERRPWNGFLPKNVHYLQADFENLILKKKFDAILLSHVIYYFSNLNEVLKKVLDLLQEEGYAYFVVNGKDSDYGPLKKAFSEITNCPLTFTYDLLKNSIIKDYHVMEHTLSTDLFFDSYDNLYEYLRLFFDLFPKEFQDNKSEIISWLKKNIKNGKFSMNQKIFVVSRR